MLLRSAVPSTSISTSIAWIVPVGNASPLPPAASVAGVNVYVVPTGMTLLQPRKNVPSVVTTSKRGEPPWHWLVLASVNDADVNVWPSRPVMSAPAAAFVDVGQFFSRCSTPLLNVECTQPVLPGSNTPGTSTAPAVPTTISAAAATAATMNPFIVSPLE